MTGGPAQLAHPRDGRGRDAQRRGDATVVAPGNPFPGPTPYLRGQADVFFGRGETIEELTSLVLSSAIVLLHAPSGCGKSSLLQAGLLPNLEAFDVLILPTVRLGDSRAAADQLVPGGSAVRDPFARMCWDTALGSPALFPARAEEPRHEPAAGLLDLVQAVRTEDDDRLVLLVLDQFEEIFLDPALWAERDLFLRDLRQMVEGDELVRVIISLRSDYLANLLPHERSLPSRLVTRFGLESLKEAPTRAAITAAFDLTAVPIAPEEVARVVDQLLDMDVGRPDGRPVRGQYVNLIQLQILCRRLWQDAAAQADSADPADPAGVRPGGPREIPDLDDMMRSFVDSALTDVVAVTGADEGILRRWLADRLVTSGGRRDLLPVDEDGGGMPIGVLEALEDARLLQLEQRNRSRWAELTHDSMVAAVQESNARWMAVRGRRRRRRTVLAAALVTLLLAGLVGLARERSSDTPELLSGTMQNSRLVIPLAARPFQPVIMVALRLSQAEADSANTPTTFQAQLIGQGPNSDPTPDSAGASVTTVIGSESPAAIVLSIRTQPQRSYSLALARVKGTARIAYEGEVHRMPMATLSPDSATATNPGGDKLIALQLPKREGIYRLRSDDGLSVLGGVSILDEDREKILLSTGGEIVAVSADFPVQLTQLQPAPRLPVGTTRPIDVGSEFVAPIQLARTALPVVVITDCEKFGSVTVSDPEGGSVDVTSSSVASSDSDERLLTDPDTLTYYLSYTPRPARLSSPSGRPGQLDPGNHCAVAVRSPAGAPVAAFGQRTLPLPAARERSDLALRLPAEGVLIARVNAQTDATVQCGTDTPQGSDDGDLLAWVPANIPCVLSFEHPDSSSDSQAVIRTFALPAAPR